MMLRFMILVMVLQLSVPRISSCQLWMILLILVALLQPMPLVIFSQWAVNQLWAIAILGFPINKLPPEVAQKIVDGGRFACHQAGISLAGGHSIDAPEPIFGLAVTGVIATDRVKRNASAEAGCKLYLTKPLGIGVLTTAEKKGK